MKRLEIWASGGGTNADAIFKYFKNHKDISVVHLGCNRIKARAFDVAKKHSVNTTYWNKYKWNATHVLDQLNKRNIDFIILAGFLKLVPSEVTKAYRGRILNIHPSLLPKFGGINMYGNNVHQAVLNSKDEQTGITIHEVNEEFDKGKPIAQFSAGLVPGVETIDSIKSKIQRLEHQNFAPIIESWVKAKSI